MKLRKQPVPECEWIRTEDTFPRCLTKGDTITVVYVDELGVEHELIQEDIDEPFTMNTVGIFKFKNWAGMKKGYGGIIGEK